MDKEDIKVIRIELFKYELKLQGELPNRAVESEQQLDV